MRFLFFLTLSLGICFWTAKGRCGAGGGAILDVIVYISISRSYFARLDLLIWRNTTSCGTRLISAIALPIACERGLVVSYAYANRPLHLFQKLLKTEGCMMAGVHSRLGSFCFARQWQPCQHALCRYKVLREQAKSGTRPAAVHVALVSDEAEQQGQHNSQANAIESLARENSLLA